MNIQEVLEQHNLWLNGQGGSKANLQGANLQYADLREANLVGVNLQGANLKGAKLLNANLQYANLQGADFRNADLVVANLLNANLEGVDLRGADLLFANLQGADFGVADLRGADLREANLKDVNFKEATGLTLNSNKGGLCEFSTGLSIEAGIIYVGCIQHTIEDWRAYVESDSKKYMEMCSSEKEHSRCVKAIKSLIDIYVLNKETK